MAEKIMRDFGNSRFVKSGDDYHVQKKNGNNWDHVYSYNDWSDDHAYTNAENHAKKLAKESTQLTQEDLDSMLEYVDVLEAQLDNLKSSTKRRVVRDIYRTGDGYDAQHAKKFATALVKNQSPESLMRIKNAALRKESTQLTKEDLDSMLEYIDALETELGINESVENPIIDMIDSLMSGELHESNSLFYDLIGFKLNEKIEYKKIEVAQSIIGESDDDDEDDQNEKEFANKHPVGQLERIADHKELTDDEALEKNADGSVDQRSLRALNDRKAKGGSTSSKPLFHHTNGEKSDIHPKHAQALLDIIRSDKIKPETKQALQDKIYGSKAGLEKVKGVLGIHE